MTCKSRPRNDLWCVEWDVKPLHYYDEDVPAFKTFIRVELEPAMFREMLARLRPPRIAKEDIGIGKLLFLLLGSCIWVSDTRVFVVTVTKLGKIIL